MTAMFSTTNSKRNPQGFAFPCAKPGNPVVLHGSSEHLNAANDLRSVRTPSILDWGTRT